MLFRKKGRKKIFKLKEKEENVNLRRITDMKRKKITISSTRRK